MDNMMWAILLALQEIPAAHNSSPVLSVVLFAIMIGVVMVCLLIVGVLSFSTTSRSRDKRRT